MQIQAYLFFDGRCDEAIAFYQKALGAQVKMLMRYNEAPESPPPGSLPPGSENKVMHATLQIGETPVMMSDGHCGGAAAFEGFSLSAVAQDVAEADRLFAALGDGGTVTMPISKTFFSPRFGMLKDRFGVAWMVMAQH
jgi:PhnB protein